MKVLILCGGKGTRLKEKTESLPKPLVEIGDRPILWHIMKIYSAYGFNDFVLCLGYKGHKIKEYFMDSLSWKHQDFALDLGGRKPEAQLINGKQKDKWKIHFADTGEETNTGGRVKKVADLIKDDLFMVTYGDGVANVNIKELVDFHKNHGKLATITATNPPSQFGLLEMDKNNLVTQFQEKPSTNQWINGGFFVFKKKFLDYLEEDSVLEKEPLEKISSEGELVAYKHDSFWKCMDTYKDTMLLKETWEKGDAPWKVWE